MYMVKITRDDDGYWGYEKGFNQFITKEKERAFNKAIEELRNIVQTIRGRNNYPNEISESISSFLNHIDSEKTTFNSYDGDSHFNKKEFEIYFNFEWGNAHFHFDIVEVLVSSNETDFSYIEL